MLDEIVAGKPAHVLYELYIEAASQSLGGAVQSETEYKVQHRTWGSLTTSAAPPLHTQLCIVSQSTQDHLSLSMCRASFGSG